MTARRRRNDFARIYDLPRARDSRRACSLARPIPEREARKELLRLAARHHGVATFTDLTDYHRQANAPCKPLVAELVEEGELLPVQVEGWKQPGVPAPRRAPAAPGRAPVRC